MWGADSEVGAGEVLGYWFLRGKTPKRATVVFISQESRVLSVRRKMHAPRSITVVTVFQTAV